MTTQLNHKPEFFRLPVRGGDPYFGITRAAYYRLEERGDIKFVRIRERGKLRGITLVPYDQVAAFIRSQAQAQGVYASEASSPQNSKGHDTALTPVDPVTP